MRMLVLAACADAPPSSFAEAPAASDSGWRPSSDSVAPTAAAVLFNEAMTHNDSVAVDEAAEAEDWIELYAAEAVDLEGWTLSDGDLVGTLSGTLAAGERRLLWADAEEGADHLPFRLGDADELVLADPAGVVADRWSLPELVADTSWGRFPDGSSLQRATIWPTPGLPNPRDPGLDTDPTERLFDDDEVIRLDLWLPEDSLAALRADASTYVEAGVGFEGGWIAPIGARLKGQYGSARTIDQKCAFRLSIDEYVAGARLRGAEHLTLNNMVQDASFVRERETYALFRAMGVPAPRVGHVELWVSGELRGLYLAVETPDEAFLARWFGSADGNLYEGAYGPDLSSSYTSLELDRDGPGDVEPFTELAELAALLAQSPSEDRVAELEALVDVDEVVAMWAVEVLSGHWDGYYYYPNNYRVYHDPSTGKISLLPWGTDQTWGWMGGVWSPAGDLAAWALQVPSLRERFDLAIWAAADAAVALGLHEDAAERFDRLLPWIAADPYKEFGVADAQAGLATALGYLEANPDTVLAAIFPDGAP